MPASLDDWLDSFGTTHPSHVLRGLDRVREVAERLQVNPPAPCTIVIGGTNGKGSTVAVLEALLATQGRVGATVSPHLHRFTERVRIDRRESTERELVDAFVAIEAASGDIPLSYFEQGILAALYRHRLTTCDFSLLEVGLGGRLDAVNIVDGDLTIITNIGFDHQEYLGDTLEKIGAEKAGIVRPGVPLVFGAADPPQSVVRRAHELGAPLFLAGREFGIGDDHYYVSDRQARRITVARAECGVAAINVATALQATALIEPAAVDAWPQVAASIENPGRFEVVERHDRTFAIDVAHNVDGARFLAAQIATRFGRVDLAIVGTLNDKDPAAIVDALTGVVSEFAFVDTTGPRGQEAARTAERAGVSSLANGPLERVLDRALSSTSEDNGVILVLGSFDLVERMRDWLEQ